MKRQGEIKRDKKCAFIELWLQAVLDWDLDNGDRITNRENKHPSFCNENHVDDAARNKARRWRPHTHTHTNIHERSCWSLCQRYHSLCV